MVLGRFWDFTGPTYNGRWQTDVCDCCRISPQRSGHPRGHFSTQHPFPHSTLPPFYPPATPPHTTTHTHHISWSFITTHARAAARLRCHAHSWRYQLTACCRHLHCWLLPLLTHATRLTSLLALLRRTTAIRISLPTARGTFALTPSPILCLQADLFFIPIPHVTRRTYGPGLQHILLPLPVLANINVVGSPAAALHVLA